VAGFARFLDSVSISTGTLAVVLSHGTMRLDIMRAKIYLLLCGGKTMATRTKNAAAVQLDRPIKSTGGTHRRVINTTLKDYTVMSSKGQVVIPAHMRKTLDLRQRSRLHIQLRGNQIVLIPEHKPDEADWRSLQGIYKGEGLTKRLEEEHARERDEEDRKARR
jgi:AbrB family looped-hinge helix DNA binding protein